MFKLDHGGWIAVAYPLLESVHAIEVVGGALWRRGPNGIRLAVVPGVDGHELPKQRVASGQNPLVALHGELISVTGARTLIGRRLPNQFHPGPSGPEFVAYWAAHTAALPPSPMSKTRVQWVAPSGARSSLRHVGEVQVLNALGEAPPIDSLLLMQPPHANRPEDCSGDGARRARAHVETLQRVLAAFGVGQVWTDPGSAHATATDDLAAHLNIPVHEDARLSDFVFSSQPESVLSRVCELATGNTSSVICATAALITGVLTTLSHDDGLVVPTVQAPPGALWSLAFQAGRLVAADYYAAPTLSEPP